MLKLGIQTRGRLYMGKHIGELRKAGTHIGMISVLRSETIRLHAFPHAISHITVCPDFHPLISLTNGSICCMLWIPLRQCQLLVDNIFLTESVVNFFRHCWHDTPESLPVCYPDWSTLALPVLNLLFNLLINTATPCSAFQLTVASISVFLFCSPFLTSQKI